LYWGPGRQWSTKLSASESIGPSTGRGFITSASTVVGCIYASLHDERASTFGFGSSNVTSVPSGGIAPVGLLAWNAQLLGEDLDRDFVLTNVLLYWLTATAGPAARLYYENAHATPPTEPITAPIGLAAFSGDFSGIRRFANRGPHEHRSLVDVRGRGTLPGAQAARCPRRVTCGSSSGTCARPRRGRPCRFARTLAERLTDRMRALDTLLD